MEKNDRLNNLNMVRLQHFECNKEKCWVRMGIITVTMMTGFTLSMSVASANVQETSATQTETTKASTSSVVDSSEQQKGEADAAQVSSSSASSSSAESTPDAQSSASTSSSAPDSSSQSQPATEATKPSQQPAVDVNGHSLALKVANSQSTTKQPSVTPAAADQKTGETTAPTGNPTVLKDQTGNYWVSVTGASTNEKTGVNTYTQLTDYTYAKNNYGYTVTGYTGKLQKYLAGGTAPKNGYATAITIPDTYNGDAVTAIADYAFDNESDRDQLQIVKALTQVTLGKNISSIGTAAFAGNALTGEVVIPNSVQSIGDDAYADNQITSVVLGTGTWYTGRGSFANNRISHLDLGTGVTLIGNDAFANNQLTALTVPDQVGLINNEAFQNNKALTTVRFGQNSKLTGIGTSAFEADAISSLTLPKNVVNIGDRAFTGNHISVLALDHQIQTIGTSAFAGNQIKGAIVIPDTVTYIGDNAFTNNQIDQLTLSKNVETIGDHAFMNNQISGTVTIPEKVISIGIQAFENNKISELVIDKPDSAINQTIATDAFAKNAISKVADYAEKGSADYLSNQQARVDVAAQATDTQIKNVRSAIEEAVGVTLPDELIFKDKGGKTWFYDVKADTLTIPNGEKMPDQATFQFSSVGSGSYGTNDLVIHLKRNKTASSPAIFATTITVNYQTPDGITRGSMALTGNPGIVFHQDQILTHVPEGWQLGIPVNELPRLIAQTVNQTIVISLAAQTKTATAPALAATTTTVNYQTPDGITRGSMILIGNPGTVFHQNQILTHVPKGWQLGIPVNELPKLVAQTVNQTIVISLAAQTKTATAPALAATTTTVNYQTPDGITRGSMILIGNPGTVFHQDQILTHVPKGWQLGIPVNELPKLVAQMVNQTIVISLAAQTKTATAPALAATTTTVNYQTPDGITRGSMTLIGNPGVPFDRYQVLEQVPANWQLAIPVSELPLLIAQARNQTVIIPLMPQDDTPTGPSQGSSGTATSGGGNSQTSVPSDPEPLQPNATSNDKGMVTTPADDQGAYRKHLGKAAKAHAVPEITENEQGGKAVATTTPKKATAAVLSKDSRAGRVAGQIVLTTRLKAKTANKLSVTRLPQTNETVTVKPTLLGGLLLSILGWLGLPRRKHEKK
ncbi:adhesion exoprotein [Secundilactobacillus pentosiphilus]|uniref:Adhesion exoprotein n=1 Tax=Secundilactobacillus pentosiphilus TaxID=1714682 RepID=A0A1Z5ITF7_9LACO|nr:leucine-rich repeat domain-containing protein [Secundilactobacillus pentosiphilus]GAX05057.1 adhesion exoprotein [Secundilactobacillus pentosiphilus]